MGNVKVMSVGELIARLEDTAKTTSRINPNRNLIMNGAFALRQLVDRVSMLEDKLKANGIEIEDDLPDEMVDSPKIVMPTRKGMM